MDQQRVLRNVRQRHPPNFLLIPRQDQQVADAPERVRPVDGNWRLPPQRPIKYTDATRTQALQRVREGVSYRQIAKEVDPHCSTATIFKWVAKARAQGLLPPETPRRQADADAAAAQPQDEAQPQALGNENFILL